MNRRKSIGFATSQFNRRSSRILKLGLLVSFIALTASNALVAADRQSSKANWDNLKQLAPGQQIKVVLNDAKSYQGKFASTSDDSFVLRLATGEQSFSRQSVLRVSSKGQSHRWRNAGIGAAVGGGSLAGIAAAKYDGWEDFSRGQVAVAGLIGGGAIGAAIGAVRPTGRWYDVYRAR